MSDLLTPSDVTKNRKAFEHRVVLVANSMLKVMNRDSEDNTVSVRLHYSVQV